MLYWLSALSDTLPVLNVFRYITLRTGGAMVTALALVFLLGPWIAGHVGLRRGANGPIRPGGLIVLAGLLTSTLIWARLLNPYIWIVVGVTLGFALVGRHGDHLDLQDPRSAVGRRTCLAIEGLMALAACLAIAHLGGAPFTTALMLPFVNGPGIDLGLSFVAVGTLVIVSLGNVINLADRLHGLAVVPLILIALSFGCIAFLSGNAVLAAYLQIDYVGAAGELAVLCGAAIGAGLGLLWLRAPAGLAGMSGAGSLALGGMLGTVAVATRHEVVLALLSALFLVKPAPARG